jgi:hypothetical protein
VPPYLFGIHLGMLSASGRVFLLFVLASLLPVCKVQTTSTLGIHTEYSNDFASSYFPLEIQLSYTNSSTMTLYITDCHGSTQIFEKYIDEQWLVPYLRSVYSCLQIFEVEPSETFKHTFIVNTRLLAEQLNLTNPKMEGDYRITWDIYTNLDESGVALQTLLPLEQRISSTFRIESL